MGGSKPKSSSLSPTLGSKPLTGLHCKSERPDREIGLRINHIEDSGIGNRISGLSTLSISIRRDSPAVSTRIPVRCDDMAAIRGRSVGNDFVEFMETLQEPRRK